MKKLTAIILVVLFVPTIGFCIEQYARHGGHYHGHEHYPHHYHWGCPPPPPPF
jgi:hypothetical protein